MFVVLRGAKISLQFKGCSSLIMEPLRPKQGVNLECYLTRSPMYSRSLIPPVGHQHCPVRNIMSRQPRVWQARYQLLPFAGESPDVSYRLLSTRTHSDRCKLAAPHLHVWVANEELTSAAHFSARVVASYVTLAGTGVVKLRGCGNVFGVAEPRETGQVECVTLLLAGPPTGCAAVADKLVRYIEGMVSATVLQLFISLCNYIIIFVQFRILDVCHLIPRLDRKSCRISVELSVYFHFEDRGYVRILLRNISEVVMTGGVRKWPWKGSSCESAVGGIRYERC